VILVAVASAGDHDVKAQLVESRRLVAFPVRAFRISALRSRPVAAVVPLWLVGMFFADEAVEAMTGHWVIGLACSVTVPERYSQSL